MRFDLKIDCTCNGCLEKVNKLRRSIQGVDSIDIHKNRGIATISGTADPDTVIKALAKVKKHAVLLREQSQPVPPSKQVQESCNKKHQAAKGNAPITVTFDPSTLKKEHEHEHEKEKEKENKKAGLQQKPVTKIHGQQPVKKTNDHQQLGLQQQPVKKTNDRQRKVAPQPGFDESTRKRTPNYCLKLKKKHEEENKQTGLQQKPVKKTNDHQQLGLQQQPVKKTNDRLRKVAPQPGLDESTRKRTLNCCQKSGHKLELKPKSKRFTCIGCKEEGFGPRYICEPCDYDFHKECTSPKETTTHELFEGSTFKLLAKSDKNIRTCDACGRRIYGCYYHCEAKNLDMHPCCSNLKGKLCIGDTDFILSDKVKDKCLWCKKTRPGWSYVSKKNEFYCHVYCIWQMVFETWKKGGFHGTDDDDNSTMALSKIDLNVMANSNGNGGGRRSVILKSVCTILSAIIGILLGDPMGIVFSTLMELMSTLNSRRAFRYMKVS